MALHSRTTRPERILEPILALGVIALLYLDVWVGVPWYPTWLSVGPLTLPWSVFPPLGLAAAVLGRLASKNRAGVPHTWFDLMSGLLAAGTIVAGAYAIANLNLAAPGLYVAGIVPIFFGLLLAGSILVVALRRYWP